MPLSEADRRALRDRQHGLRSEITSLESDKNSALAEAHATNQDAKLVAEVARLEQLRDAAANKKDQADGSVEAAIRLMESMTGVAEVVSESTTEVPAAVPAAQTPTLVTPLLGATTEKKEG